MAFSRPELGRGEALEHGTTRGGRWLRERRIALALWIALTEGILIVFDVIPWGLAVLIAVATIVGYFVLRDRLPDTLRQAGWIAAASQAVVAIVPVLLVALGFLALVVLAIVAVIVLLILLGDRR